MNEISKDQKQKIIDAINNAGVNQPCPRCRNEKFGLVEGFFMLPTQTKLTGIRLGDSVPSVAVACSNCGFLSLHALGALGLLEEFSEKAAREAEEEKEIEEKREAEKEGEAGNE